MWYSYQSKKEKYVKKGLKKQKKYIKLYIKSK